MALVSNIVKNLAIDPFPDVLPMMMCIQNPIDLSAHIVRSGCSLQPNCLLISRLFLPKKQTFPAISILSTRFIYPKKQKKPHL